MMKTHGEDHIPTKNTWFVWCKTSYSGVEDVTDAGRTNNEQQRKIVLLGLGYRKAESHNID